MDNGINDDVLSMYVESLKSEQEHLLDGGTEYRQETAKLAIKVALRLKNIESLLTKTESERIVAGMLNRGHDKERLRDVAKMLRMHAIKVNSNKIITDDMHSHVRKILRKSKMV